MLYLTSAKKDMSVSKIITLAVFDIFPPPASMIFFKLVSTWPKDVFVGQIQKLSYI